MRDEPVTEVTKLSEVADATEPAGSQETSRAFSLRTERKIYGGRR